MTVLNEHLQSFFNEKEKVFKTGSLYRAMRASVAIPGVVLPIRINDLDLMQEKLTELTLRIHNPEILVSISRSSCRSFEFHRSEEMIELGRKAFLKSYQKQNSWNRLFQK